MAPTQILTRPLLVLQVPRPIMAHTWPPHGLSTWYTPIDRDSDPRRMTQGPVPRHSDTSAYTLYHMVLGATPAIIPPALQQRYISLILLFLFKHA